MNNNNASKKLKKLRQELGMSQAYIARATNLHPSTISNLERGKQKWTFYYLKKISDFFDVDLFDKEILDEGE
jgi:transcriptional regulator with XRE-family HTH domain